MDQPTVVSMKIKTSTQYADIQSDYLLGHTKRMIDIICSIIRPFVITALPVLLATIIIKLVDHVPPVYCQERFGIRVSPSACIS